MPHAAITTDIIVGFPGETDDDFAQTVEVVEAARFASAFTFQYSPRPGTPAATMPDQIPADVVRERYQRLVRAVDDIAWAENRAQVGRTVEVLLATGEGRKDDRTERRSGRAADNRLVHVADVDARPGDMVTAEVTYAAPHHLVADVVHGVRRTRAGDAWEQRDAAPAAPAGVALGMPTLPAARTTT
jgi:tRNA-2-methylthio-N6-dimethylallyladenosine synthase